MEYLQVTAAAQPNLARPHQLLGKCYVALKDSSKALPELNKAAQLEPADPQTHFVLSQLYREQGDKESSARELKEFERLSLAEKQKTYGRAVSTPQ